MQLWHVKPDTGAIYECAQPAECPYGRIEDHYRSGYEARQSLTENSSFDPLQKSSLKTLTPFELEEVLLAEAEEAGIVDLRPIEEAMNFAISLHRGQVRSAAPWEVPPPYISHPLRNAIRLLRWGVKDPVVILVAILHDTVEDGTRNFCENIQVPYEGEAKSRVLILAHLKNIFGAEVAIAVEKISNPLIPYKIRSAMSEDEKVDSYKAHVASSIADDLVVFLCKISDFQDNAAGLYHVAFAHRELQNKKQANKYMKTLPVFHEELRRNPIKEKELRDQIKSILSIMESRLKKILGE